MIAVNDPRHGRRAGYIAGCRDDCCRPHHLRYQKMSTLRRHREGSQYIPSDPTIARLAWWDDRGVARNAIGIAAGIGSSTLLKLGSRVRKATEAAVLGVTWADLPDTTFVNAELTRQRIYSLMAAGHTLAWISEQVPGMTPGGKWRGQEKVSLGFARGVLTLYDTAPDFGPSRISMSKARNRAHLHPIGWDDPGTPAERTGWHPHSSPARPQNSDDIDPVAVERAVLGEHLPLTRAERHEAIRRWPGSINQLEKLHPGWNVSRDLRAMRAEEQEAS